MKNTYDLNYDFKEVKSIFVEEVLCEEDLEEGLTSEIFEIKVALTSHAVERMYDTENRDVDWEEVESVLLTAGQSLLDLRNGEEFNVFTSDKTFAIIGNAHYQDGGLVLIVHTIIRVQTKRGDYKKLVVKGVNKAIVVGF